MASSSINSLMQQWNAELKNDNPVPNLTDKSNIAAKILRQLIQEKKMTEIDMFVSSLSPEVVLVLAQSETCFTVIIQVFLKQSRLDEVVSLLRNASFGERPRLISLWDSVHYRKREKEIGGSLTPMLRYRVRQKNPPPPNLCSTGIRPTKVLPRAAKEILRKWFEEHIEEPYPNPKEKKLLSQETELSVNQVKTWFANARRKMNKKRRGLDSMSLSVDDYPFSNGLVTVKEEQVFAPVPLRGPLPMTLASPPDPVTCYDNNNNHYFNSSPPLAELQKYVGSFQNNEQLTPYSSPSCHGNTLMPCNERYSRTHTMLTMATPLYCPSNHGNQSSLSSATLSSPLATESPRVPAGSSSSSSVVTRLVPVGQMSAQVMAPSPLNVAGSTNTVLRPVYFGRVAFPGGASCPNAQSITLTRPQQFSSPKQSNVSIPRWNPPVASAPSKVPLSQWTIPGQNGLTYHITNPKLYMEQGFQQSYPQQSDFTLSGQDSTQNDYPPVVHNEKWYPSPNTKLQTAHSSMTKSAPTSGIIYSPHTSSITYSPAACSMIYTPEVMTRPESMEPHLSLESPVALPVVSQVAPPYSQYYYPGMGNMPVNSQQASVPYCYVPPQCATQSTPDPQETTRELVKPLVVRPTPVDKALSPSTPMTTNSHTKSDTHAFTQNGSSEAVTSSNQNKCLKFGQLDNRYFMPIINGKHTSPIGVSANHSPANPAATMATSTFPTNPSGRAWRPFIKVKERVSVISPPALPLDLTTRKDRNLETCMLPKTSQEEKLPNKVGPFPPRFVTPTSTFPQRFVTPTSAFPQRFVTPTSTFPQRLLAPTSTFPHQLVTPSMTFSQGHETPVDSQRTLTTTLHQRHASPTVQQGCVSVPLQQGIVNPNIHPRPETPRLPHKNPRLPQRNPSPTDTEVAQVLLQLSANTSSQPLDQ